MTPAREPFSVAIVGAGLTGLTAAWRLQSAGLRVKVFEKADVAGGRTMSIRKDGFVFDVGAITMLPTYAVTCALIAELGISAHLHKMQPLIGIPRNGRIHRLDLSRPVRSLLATKLISFGAKLRLLKLLVPMLRSWNRSNYQSLSPLAEWDGETIASYVKRELGDEINEYIAGPIIRGNTLNSTSNAPIGELLWMLRQYAAPYVYGFDRGINFLAETLSTRLPVEYRMQVQSVSKQHGKVRVAGQGPQGGFSESFDACIIALPPPALLELAPNLGDKQRRFLHSAKPLRSVNVHLGLRRPPPISETFVLPPESEHRDLTTIVMDHLKAPGRAPAGKAVVSLFFREEWSAANFERPDPEILNEALRMARGFIGDVSADVETYVVQRWPYAIIRSERGLYQRIRDYESEIDESDCVQFGSDFLSMGMEAAVSSGKLLAERIQRLGVTAGAVDK
ncbi:MAG: hypothetical protein JWQ90_808 [Hydrocarboniphaga sp.]|uniref:protoporphyrinogen/coproporphyrinogen oxidase n=1 Tax=Hydrocarboniphaga sp. TaxID=2033016 RepID=UPI002627CFEF|nr:NAD(P)/FAD-dependent oxidoreductase [Hydrocarboniphaga sp.]MDB5968358.1 hypothetical protein [Hydrocarboniphaga sp.]